MAHLFLRFPGNRHKALTFSYDDGPREDARLAALFDKYGIKATFNLNSGSFPSEDKKGSDTFRMTKEEAYELFHNSNHEVAVHTLSHAMLDKIGVGEAAYEVAKDRENLEELFGGFIRGMSYPYGHYFGEDRERVKAIVRDAGILYARTSDETHDFAIPEDWLMLDPTCHHADPQIYDLLKKFFETDYSKRDRDPLLFYIWGHSFEFGPNFSNNWPLIEELAEKCSGREDVWYATNIEIFSYIEAYNRLLFSRNKRYVYNPTQTELCFFFNEKDYTIKPGETITLD